MRAKPRATPFAPALALLLGVLLVSGAGWQAASRADGFHSVLMAYKSVYDYWKENKDRLGFGEGEGTYQDDTGERAAALEKRLTQIRDELRGTLTASERQKLLEEQNKLHREYEKVAALQGFGGTGAQRRKAFMNELVKGMEFINSYNVRPKEFPVFSRDYNGELNGIAKIFLEIGEPAAEYLWEAVRNEARFNGMQGFKERQELEQKRSELQRKIQNLSRTMIATRDPVRKAKLVEEIQALAKELSGVNLNLGNNDPNDGWNGQPMRRNLDFVQRMEEVLVELGEKAAPVLAVDLGHANANVVKEAAELLRRIGKPAVPALVLQLGIQGREKPAADVLRRIAGRDLGTDAERWKDYFRSKGLRFPGDLAREQPRTPAKAPERPTAAAEDPPLEAGGEALKSPEEAKKALMEKLFENDGGEPNAPAPDAPAPAPSPKAPDGLAVEEDDANKIPADPAGWSDQDLEISPREGGPSAAK